MNAIAQASAPVSGSKLDNRRVLAALIDLAVVAAGGAVILAAAGVLGEPPSQVGAPLSLVTLGWALYYYFACESGNGQTLGKRVMNIRVVRTDGQPADMREIAVRTVLRVVDGLFLYLVGLIVMMATGERRGRLGDLAGGTMIVSADQPAAIAPMPAQAEPVTRVPIAESGPAFAPVPDDEPDDEPSAEAEVASPEVASPALQELAADVSAVTSDPDRKVEEPEVEEEPAVEEDELPPAAEAEEAAADGEEEPAADDPAPDEPAADASEDAPAEEPAEEPAEAPAEAPASEEADEPVVEVLDDEGDEDEAVTVKSVETISAIDLVMDDSRRDA